VSEGGKSYGIDQFLHSDFADSCSSEVRADYPSWSPDGHEIAFFASTASVGLGGFARLDAPWDIYVMDAETLRPERVLTGVLYAGDLQWSPDGTRLAFIGQFDDRPGMWLLDRKSKHLDLVVGGHPTGLAWSPDDRIILTAWESGPVRALKDSIVELNVESLVR